MDIRYVPNLRWKRGEKNALRDLSVAGRENVLPLFLIGSDQFKPKKATTKKAEVPAPLVFAQEIFNCWVLRLSILMPHRSQTHLGTIIDCMKLPIIAAPWSWN